MQYKLISVFTALSGATLFGQAGGFGFYEVSTPNAGEAYAGQAAVAGDASTAYLNPAGMARLTGSHILVGGELASLSMNFERAAGGRTGSLGSLKAIPGFYAVSSMASRLRLGISANAPFGASLAYPDGWEGRYRSESVRLGVMDVQPSAAYALTRWLAVGGGVLVRRASVNKTFAVPNFLDGTSGDARVSASTHAWAVAPAAGLLASIGANTRVGFVYRGGTDLDMHGPVTLANAGTATAAMLAPMLAAPSILHVPQGANLSLVETLSSRVALLADGGWTNWRSFHNQANWRDTWRAGLGTRVAITRRLTFQCGVSYDSSPVSAWDRTPEIPVDRQIRTAFGFQHRIGLATSMGVSFTHISLGEGRINSGATPFSGPLNGWYPTSRLSVVALTVAHFWER